MAKWCERGIYFFSRQLTGDALFMWPLRSEYPGYKARTLHDEFLIWTTIRGLTFTPRWGVSAGLRWSKHHRKRLKTFCTTTESHFRDQGVGGSNPLSPTIIFKHLNATSGFPSTSMV